MIYKQLKNHNKTPAWLEKTESVRGCVLSISGKPDGERTENVTTRLLDVILGKSTLSVER
jgi:hypothetical protein